MSLFSSSRIDTAYDRWLTTTPADQGHSPECNCDPCHELHMDAGDVIKNALESPRDFQCCVDQFQDMKLGGLVCSQHPYSYFEKATKIHPAYCEGCEKVGV